MNKAIRWLKEHRPAKRRWIQLYAALLYNANIRGFVKGELFRGGSKAVCLPGLNCYSCPGAVGACPLGALQNALASADRRAPYYVLGCLLLFGILLGRTICGYLCPVGLIQELLHKIPVPKVKKNRFTRLLSYLKYVILIVFVILIPLYSIVTRVPVPAFCKYICPAGTGEGAVALLSSPAHDDLFALLGSLFTNKIIILIALVTAAMFIWRVFCRFLCPLGALYGLFNRIAVTGIRVEDEKCVSCGRCVQVCQADIRHPGDRECVACGRCIDSCPEKAITLKMGRIVLKENEISSVDHKEVRNKATENGGKDARKRRIAKRVLGLIAAAALLFELWYFNLSPVASVNDAEPAAAVTGAADEENPEEDSIPVGTKKGERGTVFEAELLDGQRFDLKAFRGKVVVLNFWATWCGPCCKELPYFDRLQADYPEDMVILAVHHSMTTEDVAAFLKTSGWDHLRFAVDTDGAILNAYGGSYTLPQTVVLDKNGVIVYNEVKSMDYETLNHLIRPLLAE